MDNEFKYYNIKRGLHRLEDLLKISTYENDPIILQELKRILNLTEKED